MVICATYNFSEKVNPKKWGLCLQTTGIHLTRLNRSLNETDISLNENGYSFDDNILLILLNYLALDNS